MSRFAIWLINPVLSLIYGLKVSRWGSLRSTLWLFTIWFGITFTVGKDTSNSDQQRYFVLTADYHAKDWNLIQAFQNYDFGEQGDLARHFLLWFVSRFTDNGQIFLIVVAIILGFFYSSNIAYVLSRVKQGKEGTLPWYVLLLIISLFFVAPIDDIGGVRFINATHMALFGLLPYLFEGKTRRMPFFFLSPLVFHFGMWILVIVFIGVFFLAKFLKSFPRIVLWSFLVTSIVSGFFQSQILEVSRTQTFMNTNPEFVEDKTSSYWSDKKIESRANTKILGGERNWYANLYNLAIRWVIILLLFFMGHDVLRRNGQDITHFKRPLTYILLLFIVFNGLSGLPGVNRFAAILNFLGLSYLIFYWLHSNTNILRLHMTYLWPAVGLFLIVSFRSAIYNMSDMTFIGSPLVAVFTIGDNAPVNEAIKGLLGY